MGIIVNKTDDKNEELSRRITSDLREKAQTSASKKDPDLAEDSEYVEQFKKTSKFGWVWIVLIALALLSLIFIMFF